MLNTFLSSPSAGNISSGHVLEPLLNNQYRVEFQGKKTIAVSQSGALAPGQQVTIADTASGLMVIASGAVSSADVLEVLIDG